MSERLRSAPLHGNQMKAVAPSETVWLSASAGTGKTQVLSSRVLRLLLQPGVSPSQILCLTFTKAGATEMAARINDKLARWVRMDPAALADELKAIGADFTPQVQARARTLFAAVLDCPGGGLRIDTIHAFSQWLLGAFPQEAGLIPGARAMEDRERLLLQRQVLADLLVRAESDPLGDPQLLGALAALSLRLGPEESEGWLMRCAQAHEVWFGATGWQEPMRGHVERLLGLPDGADAGHVAALCADDAFDVAALRRCMEINAAWKAKTGQDNAAICADWLAAAPAVRARGLDDLYKVFHTQKGDLKASGAQEKLDANYPRFVAQVAESLARVREFQTMLALTDWLVPALRLGRAFALAWDEAKKREGLIDFDDQIRRAADLLTNSDYAQWIGYKLDRRFDHILVDEAQDTNAAQWRIIDALTAEFFAGQGQRGDVLRTLFVVGDDKQAIFRFQGTSPENFRRARERVRALMLGAVENARAERGNFHPGELREFGLDRSFRTAQPVLDFVDRTIAAIGAEAIGLPRPPDRHEGLPLPGHVSLWQPVGLASESAGDEADDPGVTSREHDLADRIARQVSQWLERGLVLRKGGERRITPGDVMILVRKRGALAALLVARLHEHGVAVAGVDRLRLGAPLAVKDLVAALRFAAQPFDCLNLAALLVSPLIGWTQDQLLAHGYREGRVRLWDHLRRSSHADVAEALERLGELLRIADFEPPQVLLHWLLSGPWQGRRKLVARLGHEANDPIDELLNAAHAYAASATPSLVGFLAWFDAGEGELKREAEAGGDFVRVMTVHGAKGLQAPIVILADATANPDNARKEAIALGIGSEEGARKVPLPRLRGEEELGPIAAARAQAENEIAQEHWRLLYVAMTRAEEALFVGGALGLREQAPAPASWHARLGGVMGDRESLPDPIWDERREWGDSLRWMEQPEPAQRALPLGTTLPPWLLRAPGDEPRPPRPLAPSALGEDMAPDPPHPPGAGAEAARRGTLIHKLLERLPAIAAEKRRAAGETWLARNAPDMSKEGRRDLLDHASRVLDEPDWHELFSPSALAEVPVAARVGTRMVVGTIDRLLLDGDTVRLVDFKTTRRPPADLAEVPRAVLMQMAAYAAALAATYPGRRIEAALLYTQAPRLITLPEAVLEPLKRALLGEE